MGRSPGSALLMTAEGRCDGEPAKAFPVEPGRFSFGAVHHCGFSQLLTRPTALRAASVGANGGRFPLLSQLSQSLEPLGCKRQFSADSLVLTCGCKMTTLRSQIL